MRSLFYTIVLLISASTSAFSNSTEPQKPNPEAQQREAWSAAVKAAKRGPGDIALLTQAHVTLTPDEVFIPADEANGVMSALGNATTSRRVGLIVSSKQDANWIIDIKWVNEGYVKDGDAKEWQADDLLESLKQGTESANANRAERGIPTLDIVGWVEPPNYDGVAHRLIWSLSAREHGAPASQPQIINYNTYALGRDGYFSLDLITSERSIEKDKEAVRQLLGSLKFEAGRRYEDFDQSTDKVAAYGIAALVGGVAVKKLGLLALIGVFLVKMWKITLVGVVLAGAGIKRIFRRGKTQA
jgi:uncharacterized membrane-anchored protein